VNLVKLTTSTSAKIISFILALIFWLNVSTDASFTTTKSINVRYTQPEKGLIVASELPKTIPVNLKGTGKSLIYFDMKNITDREQIFILVNLSDLPEGEHEIILDKNQVNLGGVNDVDVVGILDNSRIKLTLDREITRNIPVRVDNLPSPKVSKGYIIVGEPEAKPELLSVSGPEETVKAINSIPIRSFIKNSISDTDRTLIAKVHADLYPFVKIEPQEVTLYFNVEPLGERVFSGIPVQMKNFPRFSNLECKPDSVMVTIHGPESKISLLTRKSLTAAIQYKTYLETEGGDIKPEITIQPEIPEASTTVTSVRIILKEPNG
jgi:YbbR domain-containing protein